MIKSRFTSSCGIRLKGHLGNRLDRMIERNVAAKDIDYITAAFGRNSENKLWQTEFWGKWMHSAVPFAAYSGNVELRKKVERGVERVLAAQEACGYIGNYRDKARCGEWDVWGMKYTMMGLMHWWDASGETRALDACRRLCDYVIGEIGPGGRRGIELWQTGNWTGYASSSILEPVVWLYRRTSEKKYLDFAEYIVRGMSEPESGPRLIDLALRGIHVADRNGYGNEPENGGEYVNRISRIKAYEMMSCYQGMLDYCEAIGHMDGDLFNAALLSAEDITAEEINLAGGSSCIERWFHGARKQHLPHARLQETCVTTTWMRLCQKFLRITDDPKWADRIERTFYNAYLAALKADDSEFTSYTPLTGNRWHGMQHCFQHEDCCNANGPRGFLCFLEEFFRAAGDGVTFNFYASANIDGVIPATGRKVSFEMYSLYPRGETVRIVCHADGEFPMRFRIPGWCCGAEVKVNGEAQSALVAGTYCTVRRKWEIGDIIELRLPMPVVAHILDHHVAFTSGPILLARDNRFCDGDLAEALFTDKRFGGGFDDGQLCPSFAPVRTSSDNMWMTFSAKLPLGAHYLNPEGALPTSVHFCDFASAGNAWSRDNSYRTWLPIERGHLD